MTKKIFSASIAFLALSIAPRAQSVDLLESARALGMGVYWDSLSMTGLLEKNGRQITFRPGDSVALLDSRRLALVDAPSVSGAAVLVSQKFIDTASDFFKESSQESPFKVGAIIIDPGHGGKDPGASQTFGTGAKKFTIKEKDITLSVGNILYKKLKESYPDKRIFITRSSDKFLSLGERTDIANSVSLNDNEAVVYVSVHVNASLDKKASGHEVWYLSPGYRRTVIDKKSADGDETLFPILNALTEEEYTTESILMAKFIMDGLDAEIGDKSKARGIKAEEWFVVRNANMPSVLVELGFLTNEAEAGCLRDGSYLMKASLGIYNGVADFIAHFERSRGFTVSK